MHTYIQQKISCIYSWKLLAQLLLVFAISLATHAEAATLSFGNPPAILDSEAPFYIDVVLDTEGQTVNAVEAAIVYPDDLLQVVEIYNGKTVITSWVQVPEENGSSIQFAGIMAGGFSAVIDPLQENPLPGNLFRIVFQPQREGTGSISFENAHVYLHDGSGTEASLSGVPLSFALQKGGAKTTEVIVDTQGPEAFVPVISQNENVFEGKYFLIFETRDVGTGVAYYEVKEGMGPWIRAESPYLLTDQSLKKKIKVIAFDNAGNATVATLGEKQNGYLLFVAGLVIVAFLLFRRRKIMRHMRISKNTTDITSAK